MNLSGLYYDGRTSRSSNVRLLFSDDGYVTILGDGVSLKFALDEIQFASRLGHTPRAIVLPNHGKCEVADNDALDAILTRLGRKPAAHWIHRLESSLVYVLLAVVLTAGFGWGMVARGIPWMAEQAAYALPNSVARALGKGTLEALDRSLFKPSELDVQHRATLQQRFATMTAELEDGAGYRLEFRKGGKIGANAFALPSGIVVVTDELVGISHNDDQVAAVLAHEIGHLEYRHSLRMAMQSSGVALLIATLTGDPFSSSALAVALPTVLVHASYSRAFEAEADDYAYAYLVEQGVPTQAFADIMLLIGDDEENSSVEQYLSTHPGTLERIERFRD